jgi:hypothetical protein
MSSKRSIQQNNRKFQKAQTGIGACPTCGRGRALVSVTPRPTLPGEVTTYCRWDDCDYTRTRPHPAE